MFEVGKKYRVVNNHGSEYFGVKVGDVCTLKYYIDAGVSWFHNENWDDDGIWCLAWSNVEEIIEEETTI